MHTVDNYYNIILVYCLSEFSQQWSKLH